MLTPAWLIRSHLGYRLYRAVNDPYFTSANSNPYDFTANSPWLDILDNGELGNAVENHFYMVKPYNDCGEALTGGVVGEFDFAIMPGN